MAAVLHQEAERRTQSIILFNALVSNHDSNDNNGASYPADSFSAVQRENGSWGMIVTVFISIVPSPHSQLSQFFFFSIARC